MRVVPSSKIASCLLLLLLLCAAGHVSAFKKPTSTSTITLNKLRGGGSAGPLDATIVAKTSTALFGIQGLLNVLCPEAMLKSYGVSNKIDEVHIIQAKAIGFPQLAIATCSGLLLLNDNDAVVVDVNTAVAYTLLVYVVAQVTSIINGSVIKMGAKNENILVWVAMNSIAAYGLLSNADWSTNLVKVLAGIAIVTSGIIAINPTQGMKVYGSDMKLTSELELGSKTSAYWMIASSLQLFAIVSDVDIFKSIGYVWIVGTILIVDNVFLSNNHKSTTEKKLDAIGAAFLLFALAAVGTLAL